MAQGEGRTLDEAFDDYAKNKSRQVIDEMGDLNAVSFQQGLDTFETYYPVLIEVKVRPANQWVKGYRVQDSAGS